MFYAVLNLGILKIACIGENLRKVVARVLTLLCCRFAPITKPMKRYFDMTDHARLPQRFQRENRSVLARLR